MENHFEFILKATGVVTSPNHPGNYPDNLNKTEILEVESGKILRLEFTRFAVWSCHIKYCGTCDFVKITDGDGTTLMDNSCGYSLPSTITTRTNTVEIFFHTDGDRTYAGWSLSWIAVTPGSKDFIQTASFIHLNCHYKHFYAESMAIQMDQIDHKKLCFDQLFQLLLHVFSKYRYF